METSSSLAILFAGLCFMLLAGDLSSGQKSSRSSDKMYWKLASDHQAVCNDFTRAGFFIRRNESSDKWIIFLESGSMCYSSETCNRRFFRREFRTGQSTADAPFGTFNPETVRRSIMNNNISFSDYVNPLMTSMECLNSKHFGNNRTITGKDILDPDWNQNPDFYGHNHILIPYCSSDLWLADEVLEEHSCKCGNLTCFDYKANSEKLQFAFRGKLIFQSIFKQLKDDFGMNNASEILLVGSSAGGVGVVNLAQWVREETPSETDLLILFDSSWFVNFQDGIYRIFDGVSSGTSGTTLSDIQEKNNRRLLEIVSNHTACADVSLGYPCCISAYCVMTTRNESGNLAYFPESGQRTFFLGSVYDIFLLAPAVMGLDDFSAITNEDDEDASAVSLVVDFVRLTGEYGGEMNSTLTQTFNSVPFFSYYLAQCFQHIYFATSSLWGHDERTLFGTSSVELSQDLVSFSHSIKSGRWNSLKLSAFNNTSLSPLSAISRWYRGDDKIRFLDLCQGLYCNTMCPDQFVLGDLTSNNWPLWMKLVVAGTVMGIAMACLLMKTLFSLWYYRLEKKQDDYLESLDQQLLSSEASLQFPDCDDKKAIAVSCLDLSYTVTFEADKHVKDEKKDQTEAVVLNDLAEDENMDKELARTNRASRQLRRRSRFIRKSTFRDFDAELNVGPFAPVASAVEAFTPTSTRQSVSLPQPSLQPLPSVDNSSEYETTYNACGCKKRITKEILRGIEIYFNPGEMIGIMGPSGCGKTTFLDLLTGRRKAGTCKGDIYVNGIPVEEIRDWYIANTGYVLQLATPYYEELTVRENLTLAAQIKLPSTFTTRERFKRVEQVMEVTGLSTLAETMVGGETGPGLSGGQKRRLVVALQLLKMPSIIFLDEPTSGLDATSSMELLSHLNKLADSKRTVVLTIHQPRLEIFHMFHKLVLLSDGKVAYHGVPEKAYEVFVSALRASYLEKGLIIPSLEDHNPADVIMDMLGNSHFRQILTEYYQESEEPKLVRLAIKVARWKEYSHSTYSKDTFKSSLDFAIFGARRVGRRHASSFVRMAALEARAAKRILFNQLMFLPLMFFAFAIVLGTVYFQNTRPFLVVSGMCVFSVASGLFVFPAIELYYTPAIRVYAYERADGVGRSQDLVLQGFIRYISIAFVPVIVSTGIIYVLLINHEAYDFLVFLQVSVVNVALNLTWTAMLIALILAFPRVAFRLSSAIASVAGFTSGFFIPIENIGWWYRWLSYINPNYYGFSSVAFFLLEDFNLCEGSQLECYFSSGAFTLQEFFFDKVNPYLHILVLLCFTFFYLGLAIFANWSRHTSVGTKLKRLKNVLFGSSSDELYKEIKTDQAGYERSISNATSLDNDDDLEAAGYELEEEEEHEQEQEGKGELQPGDRETTPLYSIPEGEEEEEETKEEEGKGNVTPRTRIRGIWKSVVGKTLDGEPESTGAGNSVKRVRLIDAKRPSKLSLGSTGLKMSKKTPFLREGETHKVWRPKKRPQLADFVELLRQKEEKDKVSNGEVDPTRLQTPKDTKTTSFMLPTTPTSASLQSRQKNLFNRVIATQAVLKETTDELLNEKQEEMPKKPRHMSLLEASKKVTANIRRQKAGRNAPKSFSDIVSEYLAKSKEERSQSEEKPVPTKKWNTSKKSLLRKETRGAIPISTWREIVREGGKLSVDDDASTKRYSTGGVSFPTDHTSISPVKTSIDSHNTQKLNKMAQLKKNVAERNMQRQNLLSQSGMKIEVSTEEEALKRNASEELNKNMNNSSTSSLKEERGGVHMSSPTTSSIQISKASEDLPHRDTSVVIKMDSPSNSQFPNNSGVHMTPSTSANSSSQKMFTDV